MYIDFENVIGIFFGLVFVGILMFVGIASYQEVSFQNKFKTGEISLETFCERYKTENNPPVSCYDYFNVKKTGDKLNCNFNPTIKTTICSNVPVLSPKP